MSKIKYGCDTRFLECDMESPVWCAGAVRGSDHRQHAGLWQRLPARSERHGAAHPGPGCECWPLVCLPQAEAQPGVGT